MSLYLTIFDGDTEVGGWVLGHYSDFGTFRDIVVREFGDAQYPILLQHSDSDGEWNLQQVVSLKKELRELAVSFKQRPAQELEGSFEHTAEYRDGAATLYECFHNVSGVNLFEALITLCEQAEHLQRPILFQ